MSSSPAHGCVMTSVILLLLDLVCMNSTLNCSDMIVCCVAVNVAVNQFIYLSIPLTSSPIVTENSFQLDMKVK